METIFTSLISQIKNPWQYVFIGIFWSCIIYFNINREYTMPIIVWCMGVAYIFDLIIKYIKGKIDSHKYNKIILFNLLHMNEEEKTFIKYCLCNNIQTLAINGITYLSLCSSLNQKMIAHSPIGVSSLDDIPLTIPSNVWNIICKNKYKIFPEMKK